MRQLDTHANRERTPKHRQCLMLNADYTPMALKRWKKAIKSDFEDKAKVIDFYADDKVYCGHDMYWPCPAVMVAKEYKARKKLRIPFSRKYVFIRDRLRCQYCNKRLHWKQLTFDHVIPRSKHDGDTPTYWENIVTCCRSCNCKKDNMSLDKAGMRLINKPIKPDPKGFVLGLYPWTIIQPEWIPYIPKFYLELLEVETYSHV